jgi:hypothetical protein
MPSIPVLSDVVKVRGSSASGARRAEPHSLMQAARSPTCSRRSAASFADQNVVYTQWSTDIKKHQADRGDQSLRLRLLDSSPPGHPSYPLMTSTTPGASSSLTDE